MSAHEKEAVVSGRTAAVSAVAIASLLAPLVGALAVSAADPSGPEIRYEDVRFDPDDRPVDETSCCQQDPDIRATRRKVWVDARGHLQLSIGFRAFELLVGYWTVIAQLDSSGDSGADYRITIWDDGTRQRCRINARSWSSAEPGFIRPLGPDAPIFPDGVACKIPLNLIDRDKRIRWRLVSPPEVPGEGSEPGVYEHAPDSGWYV